MIPAHWQPGDAITLRYLTRDGRPGMAWPFTVVEDTDDRVALFIPAGATYKRWGRDAAGRRALVDGAWRSDVLRLMFPGCGYSIWLFWRESAGVRQLAYYYVNMEEPFRHSEIGFDTNDHMLDIVVEPDLSSWRWKDDAEFEQRIVDGVYSRDFGQSVHRESETVVRRIEEHAPPFDHSWDDWRPAPTWQPPRLSERWATATPVLWPRAAWAYLDTTR